MAKAADSGYILASDTPMSMLDCSSFHHEDTTDGMPMRKYFEAPSSIKADLVIQHDYDCPLKRYASLLEFTKQILGFRTRRIVHGLALHESSKQCSDACTGLQTPMLAARGFTAVLRSWNRADPNPRSDSPVILFELAAPPMVMPDPKFTAASPITKVAKAAATLVVQQDEVVATRATNTEQGNDQAKHVKFNAESSQASPPASARSLHAPRNRTKVQAQGAFFSSLGNSQSDSAKRHYRVTSGVIRVRKAGHSLATVVRPALTAAAHDVALLPPTAASKASPPTSVNVVSIRSAQPQQQGHLALGGTDEFKDRPKEFETSSIDVVNKTGRLVRIQRNIGDLNNNALYGKDNEVSDLQARVALSQWQAQGMCPMFISHYC